MPAGWGTAPAVLLLPLPLRGDDARHGRFAFPPRLARGHGRRRRRGGAPARIEPSCPAGTRRTRPHPSAHVYQRSVYAQPRPGVHAVQFRLSRAVCRVRRLPLRLSRVHPRECLRPRRRPGDRRAHADRSRDSRHRPGVGGGPASGARPRDRAAPEARRFHRVGRDGGDGPADQGRHQREAICSAPTPRGGSQRRS